jgi:hypothetical protein
MGRPPTFEGLLRGYIDILNAVRIDFNRTVNETVYCMDFAELHVFMHRWQSGFSPFELINFIFEESTPQERLTIAPPHVFELLHYLQKSAENLDRYKDYKVLTRDRRVRKFLDFLGKARHSPINVDDLVNNYRRLGDYKPLMMFADSFGYKMKITDPLQRLTRLIENRRVIPFSEAVKTEGIPLNNDVYKELLNELNIKRPEKDINNQVDALTGGIVFGVCQDHYFGDRNEFYSNVVTHAYAPLNALRRLTRVDSKMDRYHMSLVRMPVYLGARITARKMYGPSNKDCASSLDQLVWMLKQFYKVARAHSGSYDSLWETLTRKLRSEYDRNPFRFRASQFNDFHMFTKRFFFDYDWNKHLRESMVDLLENDCIRNRLVAAFRTGNRDLALELADSPLEEILVMQDVLKRLHDYNDGVFKAQEKLRHDVKDLYIKLKNFVGELDSGVFSPDMISFFEKIQSS